MQHLLNTSAPRWIRRRQASCASNLLAQINGVIKPAWLEATISISVEVTNWEIIAWLGRDAGLMRAQVQTSNTTSMTPTCRPTWVMKESSFLILPAPALSKQSIIWRWLPLAAWWSGASPSLSSSLHAAGSALSNFSTWHSQPSMHAWKRK